MQVAAVEAGSHSCWEHGYWNLAGKSYGGGYRAGTNLDCSHVEGDKTRATIEQQQDSTTTN